MVILFFLYFGVPIIVALVGAYFISGITERQLKKSGSPNAGRAKLIAGVAGFVVIFVIVFFLMASAFAFNR